MNNLFRVGSLSALVLSCMFAHGELVSVRIGTPPTSGPARAKDKKWQPPVGYVLEASAAPTIDGKLDEEAWKSACVLKLETTLNGRGRASQATEILLLRDDANLYVAYRCFEPLMKKLKVRPGDHDGPVWAGDSVEFFVGPARGSRYLHFGVNASGMTYDGKRKEKSWNSGFKAAVGKAAKEWVVETALPIEKMGGKGEKNWIANFNRNRQAGGRTEEFAWSSTGSGNSHVPSRFGRLRFGNPPPPKKATKPKAVKQAAVEVLPCEGGAGILKFNLSDLPKDARIHSAELRVFRTTQIDGRHDEALVNIEIFPLQEVVKKGGMPKPAGIGLELIAPYFDRFDATDAVRVWVAGKPNGGFFVKTMPYWNRNNNCLEILYEGKPDTNAHQASDLKAAHRYGQTFLTWKEVDDPIGKDEITWGAFRRVRDGLDARKEVRYHIYRSKKQITAATLPEAERIAIVKPLSCWNVNGRNVDKAIEQVISERYAYIWGHWNPFCSARTDGQFGVDYRMERLVISEGEKPLARGTGLYVHTSREGGPWFYAVLAAVKGCVNMAKIDDANSTAEPITEKVADPEPVLQRVLPKHPYFNYREKRLHYVRWVGPPYASVPSQYYNWSVGVPDKLGKGVPLELSLHRIGRSYYKTQYRVEQDSVVVSPHDFPRVTYWYGHHEALGTLKSFKQGVIHNYTEKRLLWFVDWAAKKWPVDRNRVFVTSTDSHMGALQLGVRNPDIFNMVLGGGIQPDYTRGTQQSMNALWGDVEWKLKTNTGGVVWDELNMTKRVKEMPALTDFPVVTYTGKGMYQPQRDFFTTYMEKGHLALANFGVYGGGRVLPITQSGTWSRMIYLDIRKNRSFPSFRGPGTKALYGKAKEASGNLVVSDGSLRYWGEFNLGNRWRTDDLVDEADRYEVTMSLTGRRRVTEATSDVTLRRLQKFKVEKGKTYAWAVHRLQGEKEIAQQGEVTVAENGLLVIPKVKISVRGCRLKVKTK